MTSTPGNSPLATPSTSRLAGMLRGLPIVNALLSPVTPLLHQVSVESVMADWSGRGSHVSFAPDETVPLEQGRFLGHGSMGSVYETKVRGHDFAWKKRFCRRKIGDKERKEIEILKKISHHHIIQLAGSYTHGPFLGLLLYPVAVCDLGDVLEDLECVLGGNKPNDTQIERLEEIGACSFFYLPDGYTDVLQCAPENIFLVVKMGCIICAVEYLHNQNIRHKDLKPSNILLSRDKLWLTDFGSATDFSHDAVSVTDNGERGTAKYMAPEMAAFSPNGRSADIFSLGCIFLEILVLAWTDNHKYLRDLRTSHDKSFQANLESIHQYLRGDHIWGRSITKGHIQEVLRRMLSKEPQDRPTIQEVGKQFVSAAKQAGVRRVVFSSVIHPVLSELANHADKAPVEEALLDSGMEYVFLHPAMFFQNIGAAWAKMKETGVYGEPWSAETRFTRVDYRDVAEVAAIALTEDRLLYGTFELCAEGNLNRHDLAALMSQVVGKQVKPIKVEIPEQANMPPKLTRMFAWYDKHALLGNSTTLRAILGREPRTLKTFFKELNTQT